MSKARKIVASRSSMRADAGRPRLTVEIEQRRQGDGAAHRQHGQAETETPMDDGGGEELAGDGGPADQDQRAQTHAAARRQAGAGSTLG